MEKQFSAAAAESGAHFTATHLGPLDQLARYHFTVPAPSPLAGRQVPGKVFLKDVLGLTGVEMSWNSIPAGAGIPFLHAHRENEEVYLFLSGRGEFMVDDAVFPIAEGSVVRVATSGARAYRNTGKEPLNFIVLQVKEGGLGAATIEDGHIVETPLAWPDAN